MSKNFPAQSSRYASKATRAAKAVADAREKEAKRLDHVASTVAKLADRPDSIENASAVVSAALSTAVNLVEARAKFLRRQAPAGSPVLELADATPLAELRRARSRQSVRVGADVLFSEME